MGSFAQRSTPQTTLRTRWLTELAFALVQEAYSDDDRGRLRSTIALGQLENTNARERADWSGSFRDPDREVASTPECLPPSSPALAPFLAYDAHYRDCVHCQHALTRCKVGNRFWWAWLEVAA